MGMWALRSDGRITIPTKSQASCQGVLQISRESCRAMRSISLTMCRFVTRVPRSSRPSFEGCPALSSHSELLGVIWTNAFLRLRIGCPQALPQTGLLDLQEEFSHHEAHLHHPHVYLAQEN
jgi:hypothetical protein